MGLQTNLTMIKLLLADIRSGAKINANDTKVLRYLMSNVHNAVIHKKLGIDKDVESPDYVSMSEEFKCKWEEAGCPTGGSALKMFGVHEHVTPLNLLIKRMIVECTDEASIFDFVSKYHRLVFITKDEDQMLNEAGLQRTLPKEGDRYDVVGIIVHPEPIQYKNHRKRKRNYTDGT